MYGGDAKTNAVTLTKCTNKNLLPGGRSACGYVCDLSLIQQDINVILLNKNKHINRSVSLVDKLKKYGNEITQ